jgi:dTDP-glucose 4,6-dehydratase
VNIGNPDEMTVLDFAKEIIRATGSRSRITYRKLPQDDPKQRQPNIAKARRLLKWAPAVPLKEGLDPTIRHFKARV